MSSNWRAGWSGGGSGSARAQLASGVELPSAGVQVVDLGVLAGDGVADPKFKPVFPMLSEQELADSIERVGTAAQQ